MHNHMVYMIRYVDSCKAVAIHIWLIICLYTAFNTAKMKEATDDTSS